MSTETNNPVRRDEQGAAHGNPFIGVDHARVTTDDFEAKSASSARRITPGDVAGGLALAGLATLGVAAGPEIIDRVNGIEYSSESTTYQVQQGDDLYSIVEQIPGIEEVDKLEVINHIKADPANIDVFASGDGTLHGGQIITVPVSVSD